MAAREAVRAAARVDREGRWEAPAVELLLQLLANGLVQGAMVACLAAGFGIVYRALRVFHVAMGAQFVFSSYAFYTLAGVLGWNPWVAGAVAVVASVAFALALEFAVYRPFARKGCSGGAAMVASLGVLIFTENALALVFGNEVKTIPHPPPGMFALGPVKLTSLQLLQFVACAALFVAVGGLMGRGRWFKASWALGDEPRLVHALALPMGALRAWTVSLAGVLVAVPALLVSADTGMDPHEGLRWLLVASMAAFFGGSGSYWAWGAGALAIGAAQAFAVWRLPAQWSDAVAFTLLLAALALRPGGLFGAPRRPEEMA